MDNKINELKKNLPKESCSFCTHLSLDGPDENLKYNVKCVIFDSLPKCNDNCEYFEPEYSGINSYDLDDLYIKFLDSCLRVPYYEYKKSIHWKLFKDYALNNSDVFNESQEEVISNFISTVKFHSVRQFQSFCNFSSRCNNNTWSFLARTDIIESEERALAL